MIHLLAAIHPNLVPVLQPVKIVTLNNCIYYIIENI